MKLHNKFLIIFVLLFVFFILFNISNVKATFDFDYNGTSYSFRDVPGDVDKSVYNNFFIYYDTNDEKNPFQLVFYPNTATCYFNTSNDRIYVTGDCSEYPVKRYYYPIKEGSYFMWYHDNHLPTDSSGSSFSNFNIDNTGTRYIIYSTADISIDKGEKTFFYHPVGEKPVPEEPAPVGVLAPLLDKEKMKETTLQIRVILPLIIVILVSFLGLRKALKLLQTILNRS